MTWQTGTLKTTDIRKEYFAEVLNVTNPNFFMKCDMTYGPTLIGHTCVRARVPECVSACVLFAHVYSC